MDIEIRNDEAVPKLVWVGSNSTFGASSPHVIMPGATLRIPLTKDVTTSIHEGAQPEMHQ